MEERKLTFREKLGVLSAIIMFLSIGMIMGGNGAGNMPLLYSGAAVFSIGAGIAIWLIMNSEDKEEEY